MMHRTPKHFDIYGNEIDTKERANALLDSTTSTNIIPEIISFEYNEKNKVNVIDSLWEDSGLETWAKSQPATRGGSHHIWNIIKTPTYDIELLKKRQNALHTLPENITDDLKTLSAYEKDIAWLFTLPPLKEAYPINILFPTLPILNSINKLPYFLTVFHIYRISIMPWFNLISPLVTILSPWYYLKKMNIHMSLKTYLSAMWRGIVMSLSGGGGSHKFMRALSIILYIGLYIYGIIQTFETASMLHTIRKNLTEKMENISKFVAISQKIIKVIPEETIKVYCHDYTTRKELILPEGLAGLYTIMTEKPIQGMILSLMRAIYSIDVCASVKNLLYNKNTKCCKVVYAENNAENNANNAETNNVNTNNNRKNNNIATKFVKMGHIILPENQIRNSVSLKKSLIITGPNAAGKTTYVRGICTNYILAQTFGIACASKATIHPVHAIGSFIRISDELGKLSLFEAEAKRCAELIKQAEKIAEAGKKAIYFLDEPMHSTPPIEGTATSIAVIEHIGKLPGIKLLVTTHYHDIIKLGTDKSTQGIFTNVSVEAKLIENDIENCNYKYEFPYKIKKGPSVQCIALELLSDKDLPKKIIKRAIEVKNKIYPVLLN
uniref:DNA mismatch repair proteins mutS family domain-containing protein n=1 Tax=viral metagenome TaxID=1070528 RepID=A0A6C0KUY8_9ZZZZ